MLDPDVVLEAVCKAFGVERAALHRRTRNDLLRSMAAKFLCRQSGYTQHKAGELLRIGHSSAVSKRLKKLQDVLETDRKAQNLCAKINHSLDSKE